MLYKYDQQFKFDYLEYFKDPTSCINYCKINNIDSYYQELNDLVKFCFFAGKPTMVTESYQII